ncbi:MAG: hypothetical protein KJ052_03730, partial [Candidatus Hydrogenedentes bacterium]|nr:hypothetical protein [Candidatus Hydrogenedentota bacterium]
MTKFAGWIVAAMAIVAVGVTGIELNKTRDQLDEARALLDQQHSQLESFASLHADAEAARARIEGLDTDLTEMQTALEAAEAAVSAASESTDTAEPSPGDEMEDAEEDTGSGASKIDPETIARAQMGALTEIMYGDLYTQLALPAETKTQVHDLLTDAFQEQQNMTVSAFRAGDRMAPDVQREKDAIDAALRDKLAAALSPQELASYDAYQTTAEQHMYENILMGQLAMISPNLTSENRDVTRQVLAEELVIAINGFESSDQPYTL